MRGTAYALMIVISIIFVTGDSTALTVPAEPKWTAHKVTAQEAREARKAKVDIYTHLFGKQAANVARFNRLDARFVWAGRVLRVPDLPADAVYTPLPAVYEPAAADRKSILIDLKRQFLGAYENGKLVASYPVSSGRAGRGTPAGSKFKVTLKDADHASSVYPEPDGGWPMPWALRFHRSEYWIHAGDLVGYPASHGCVRLFEADAKALFDWTDIGTPVRIVRSLD